MTEPMSAALRDRLTRAVMSEDRRIWLDPEDGAAIVTDVQAVVVEWMRDRSMDESDAEARSALADTAALAEQGEA